MNKGKRKETLKKILNLKQDEAATLYKNGVLVKDIASNFDVTASIIYKWLHIKKVKLRQQIKNTRPPYTPTSEQIAEACEVIMANRLGLEEIEAIKDLHEKGSSARKISKTTNRSRAIVSNIINGKRPDTSHLEKANPLPLGCIRSQPFRCEICGGLSIVKPCYVCEIKKLKVSRN